jgi:hypothetical protein
MRSRGCVFVVIILGLSMLGNAAAGDKGKKKKKDDDKNEKIEKVEFKSVTGVIRTVDFDRGSFSILVSDSGERPFLVDEDTKFVGAGGGSRGIGKAGLKDEMMVKGTEVRVMIAPNEKAAAEVHLPKRKEAAKDDAKK